MSRVGAYVTTTELGAVLGLHARTVRRRVEARHPRFAAYDGPVPVTGEHLRFTLTAAIAIAEAHGAGGRTVARWRRRAEVGAIRGRS